MVSSWPSLLGMYSACTLVWIVGGNFQDLPTAATIQKLERKGGIRWRACARPGQRPIWQS